MTVERPQAQRRFTQAKDAPLRCPACGLTLHAATIQHEQALVFASCCPRCDGQLTIGAASDSPDLAPSIYLG